MMEQTECSETSEYKIQTPGNYPEERIQRIIPHLYVQPSSWYEPSGSKHAEDIVKIKIKIEILV